VPERNRVTKQQKRARQNDRKDDEESERAKEQEKRELRMRADSGVSSQMQNARAEKPRTRYGNQDQQGMGHDRRGSRRNQEQGNGN
jgi:hypothetical protein